MYWRPSAGHYVSYQGHRAELPEHGSGRAVAEVERDGKRVGAIVYERDLWERMGGLRVRPPTGWLGMDEKYLCRKCHDFSRPVLVFEPPLPVRYYLPPEDVRIDLLAPSDTRTACAYKGHASYWSLGDAADVAWTYREPLREAGELTGRIAFFDEHVDVEVDGRRLERPVTPWSRR